MGCKISLNMINIQCCLVWTEYYLVDTSISACRVFNSEFEGQQDTVVELEKKGRL